MTFLTQDLFDHRLGETFQIQLDSGEPLELELEQVRQLGGSTTQESRRKPFALYFRGGPRDRFLPQRIYQLEHAELGSLEIFLVPVGPDEVTMRYEAIFT